MSKKFYLVLLAAVLTANYAQAQFTFGVRAGLNLTNMKMKAEGISISADMKPGFQLGVVGEYGLSESFFIQPGILFAQQGSKSDFSSSMGSYSYESSTKTTLNYLQIPVNAQYKVDLGGMKLLLQAGPYFGFAISGKQKGEETTIWGGEKETEKYDEKIDFGEDDSMKRGDFGLGIGAGLQFGNIQAGLGYNIGIANINTDSDFKTKNNSLAITLTYFFGK